MEIGNDDEEEEEELEEITMEYADDDEGMSLEIMILPCIKYFGIHLTF